MHQRATFENCRMRRHAITDQVQAGESPVVEAVCRMGRTASKAALRALPLALGQPAVPASRRGASA